MQKEADLSLYRLEGSRLNPYQREWLDGLEIRPNTRTIYRNSLEYFSDWLEMNTVKVVTAAVISEWKHDLELGLKARTVNQYLRAVKAYSQFLEQEGVAVDVTSRVRLERIPSEFGHEPLTEEQCRIILNQPVRGDSEKELRNRAMLALMMTTGLRTVEVISANVEDMRQRFGHRILYVQGKGHREKDSFVQVPKEVDALIHVYLACRRQKHKVPPKAPLFASVSPNNIGGRLTTRSVRTICKDAFNLLEEQGETQDFSAHSLRHTAATLSIANGAPVEKVQRTMRHSNINTTMMYVHDLDRFKNSPELIVAQALFEVKEPKPENE